jgi:hypothetical protein
MFSCHCFLGCSGRNEIRKRYGIEGDSFMDCCIHTFCVPCALTQEKREIENRGNVFTNIGSTNMIQGQPQMVIPQMNAPIQQRVHPTNH